jgi:prolyl oligopeptidase
LPEATPVPPADRDDVVDELHGVRVSDPYRYLEDPDAPRTVEFVAAQNRVSAPYLAALPAAGYFRDTVTALLTRPRAGTPWERGGRYFRMDNPGAADQDRLVTGDSLADLLESPRVLLDPNELAADGTAALTAAEVSPDGTTVAVAVSEAGSDWRTITVIDVATGRPLADRLEWTKWVPPTWLPDGSGFLYWRYPAPTGQEYVDEMPPGELALHRLADPQDRDSTVWTPPTTGDGAQWMADPEFSSDGRWLMLTAAPGTDSRTTIELRSVDPAAIEVFGPPIPVIAELADAHHPVDVIDGNLFLRTESGAERGRLVSVPAAASPDPQLWKEIVPEHASELLVLARPTAAGFVLVLSDDTAHRLRFVGHSGELIGEHNPATPSSVVAAHTRGAGNEVFAGFTSFTQQLTILRAVVGESVEYQNIPAGPDAEPASPVASFEVQAQRRYGTSADGTKIPMTVVRRADLPVAGPAPTLLYGYGGFDIPMVPSFSGLFAAWVQAGGVFVVANLRGGGEFGQAWHTAGMKHHKQRVFDDLYGCAETLITDGTTTTAQLAVHGRSNGGLLAGAALVQRPGLWAAALPTVGVLDMVRFHLFTTGRAWTTEYGDPGDADDFRALLAYSPLHNLVEGTGYPATLICTGDHDDRVVPAHSLKFGAQLQHCQSGDAPVLLRVDTRAGHGMGKPVSSLAAEYADQLAFAAAHTGLVPTA